MDEEAPIPYQHRWVAPAGIPEAMARAYVRHLHRRPGLWVAYALFVVLFAAILFLGYDSSLSVGSRILGGLLFGWVPALILALAIRTMLYVRTVRGARLRVYEGAVLESGFGDEAFVFRNPMASGRTSYRAVTAITTQGPFVFVRYEGNPVIACYPRELFPDDAIARIGSGRGAATDPPRPPTP